MKCKSWFFVSIWHIWLTVPVCLGQVYSMVMHSNCLYYHHAAQEISCWLLKIPVYKNLKQDNSLDARVKKLSIIIGEHVIRITYCRY